MARRVRAKVEWLKKAGVGEARSREVFGWHRDEEFVAVDLAKFSDELVAGLRKCALADDSRASRALVRSIDVVLAIRADPSAAMANSLPNLVEAIRAYVEPSPHKWLFDTESAHALPYFVKSVDYHPPAKYSPAYVEVDLAATGRGSSPRSKLTLYARDLGRSVPMMLLEHGFSLETPELVEKYESDVALLDEVADKTGSQWRCDGDGIAVEADSWRNSTQAMVRDGTLAVVVMDDDTTEGEERRARRKDGSSVSFAFWGAKAKIKVSKRRRRGDDEDEEEVEEEDVSAIEDSDHVLAPVHPFVCVFDLGKHNRVAVHVRQLTPYSWDATAAAKLVLPESTKELVDVLVRGAGNEMEDIVSGKTGGTIVIATGPPGTGKTLTAEVFSEEIRRPLYVVQCSQLGTTPEELEQKLTRVLARASRWGAILLIDEADVYVHERGSDIVQNAIVGVFLRVLEHYRGVLFLTSNRATIIDDAIMSRALAWVRYDYPDPDALMRIWLVLAEQYGVTLDEQLVDKLVDKYPSISGRNVKNLLKLVSKMRAGYKRKPAIDFSLFETASKFLDLRSDTDVMKEAGVLP